jgi:hypothetical protein
MIFVARKVRSFALCEAMVGKTMPRKPTEMAAGEMGTAPGEMGTAPGEMPTAPGEMPTATTEAAASPTMATASSTMCERGGGREHQNAG